jgi:hypothetical protein
MMAHALTMIYEELIGIGLVRNKREFSRWLARGRSYYRNVEQRGCLYVTRSTTRGLRCRLAEVESTAPRVVAAELAGVVRQIDEASRVSDLLRWTRR